MRIRITKLPSNKKALGGVLQSHGSDWSSGLITIGAGGSHEENPYDGVQLGQDENFVPNLVEEDETVYNDYVYSTRILMDEAAKAKFHFPKKKDITYAEATKKLEKEIKEHVNDPISKAGFKAQMEALAEEQERQKTEMEAARAREAFEALSPEEQTAIMQRAAQEEQMAQQAAQEQAMAEQQAMQLTPEEVMTMEQQVPMEEDYAYGGNLFDIGGLAWIKRHHPEIKNPEAVAKALEKYMQSNKGNFYAPDNVGIFGNNDRAYKWQFERAWNDLMPGVTSLGNAEKHFNKWVAAGLDRETAFRLTHSDRIYNQYLGTNRDAKKKEYDSAYARLVTSSSKPKQTRWRSADPNDTNVYATELEAKKASAAYHQRNKAQKEAATKDQVAKIESAVNKAVEQQQVQPQQVAAVVEKSKGKGQSDKSSETKTAKSATGSSQAINVGTLNTKVDNPWNEYGLPGLQEYLLGELADYNDVNHTDEERNNIRQRIADTINGIQQSYYDNIRPTLGQSTQKKSDAVGEHQRKYQEATKNRGFWDIDDEGRYYDKIDLAIDKPQGHATSDTLAGGWVDSFSGPQTWLRHMGASGDGLNDVIGQLRDIGIDYSPYNSWTIGEGKDARQLYRASLLDTTASATGETKPSDKSFEEEYPMIARPADKEQEVPQYGAPWSPEGQQQTSSTTTKKKEDEKKKIIPIHKNDNLRYAGLFGPAVGLGMQLAGVGKPDYSGIDAAIRDANSPVALADYQPIGNYLRYTPMDIWYEQNALNAQARATDRALLNSGANQGSKMAGLIANGYNSQLASGNLYRQALEYNDAKKQAVENFNRGTNIFNAQAYNQNSQFNANARNQGKHYGAQLAMQGALAKMNADAGWYNSLYGNVAGLFKGVGDLGRENYQYNQMVDLLGSGAYPGVTEEQLVRSGLYRYGANGGKIKRNKKRGLTY